MCIRDRLGERGQIGRLFSPARLGPATERTKTRAGGIDEDAVECSPAEGIVVAPVMRDDLDRVRGCFDRAPHQLGTVLGDLVRAHGRARKRSLGAEHRRLATRTRTEIEPTLPLAHWPRTGQCECGKLRTLILHAHIAVWGVDRVERARRIAALELEAERRYASHDKLAPALRVAAERGGGFGVEARTGQQHEVDLRRGVVCLEELSLIHI